MKKGQKLRPSFFVFAFCVFIFLTGCGGLSGISIKNIEQEKNYYQSFINYPPLPREARRLVIHNPQQAIQSKKIISPIILSPGWNTISFPYKQINSTSGFSYYLYKFNGSGYDEIDPVNHPEAIDCHYGYWTYSENVIEVHVEGVNNVSPDRLIKIKLLSGWNFLGVPFEAAQPFEGVRVQSSEEVKYLTQVVSVDVPHGPDDWLYACVYNFSDASWKTQNILQSGTLEPGKGYWFWSWRDVELFYELPGWTFLVYMDGTNDLESKADEDFNEMLQIGSNEEIKIIVQQSKLSEDGRVKRWDIIQESPSILADLGVLDMSDPSTINNFITWGMRTYPAENYALVLWNHGAGWKNKGIITDDINSQTTTMLELKTALTGLPNRLNIIVCDASLMQMIECAYQIKQYADYLVASEETIPNHGFPYQIILGILRVNPGASPEEFATTIGTQYLNYYGETDNVTMSVVDLERISDLVTAINIFGDLLNQNFNNYVNEIEIARYSSQNYAIASYMDIYDFAERIMFQITQTDIVTAAQQVKEAVNHTIIFSGYKGFPVSSSHGIAIFFPLSSEDPSIWNDVDGNSYQDLDFVNDLHAAPQWNEFIIDYYYSLLFNTSKKEIL